MRYGVIVLKAWSLFALARVSIVEYKINTRPAPVSSVFRLRDCILRDCIPLLRQLGTPLFYFEFVTTLFLSFVILYRQLGTPHYRYTLSPLNYRSTLSSTRHPLTLLFRISPTWRPFTTPSLFYSVYRQLGAPSLLYSRVCCYYLSPTPHPTLLPSVLYSTDHFSDSHN